LFKRGASNGDVGTKLSTSRIVDPMIFGCPIWMGCFLGGLREATKQLTIFGETKNWLQKSFEPKNGGGKMVIFGMISFFGVKKCQKCHAMVMPLSCHDDALWFRNTWESHRGGMPGVLPV